MIYTRTSTRKKARSKNLPFLFVSRLGSGLRSMFFVPCQPHERCSLHLNYLLARLVSVTHEREREQKVPSALVASGRAVISLHRGQVLNNNGLNDSLAGYRVALI